MKKQSDALSTAWQTIKAPVVAAHTAAQDRQKQEQKEQEMLARAVRRNVRERQARQLAKGVSLKVGHAKEGTMLHSGGHSESNSSAISEQEKKALHRNISHLMDKLPKEGPVKGIKITKKTVSVKPVAKITKVKKPVTVCDLSKKGKDADMNNLTHNQKVKFAALITRKYMALGQEKQAFTPGTALGGLIGAARAPEGKGLEGLGRGGFRGWSTEMGGGLGALLGLLLGKGPGGLIGAGLGGYGGFKGSGGILGKPSWEVGKTPAKTPVKTKKAGVLNLTSTQRVKVAALIINKYQEREKRAFWGAAARGLLGAGKAGLGALRGGAGGLTRAAGKGLTLGGKALERGVTTGGNIASRGAAGSPGIARQAIGRGMQRGGAAMQRLPGAAQTMANRGLQAGGAAAQRLPAQAAAGLQGLGRAGNQAAAGLQGLGSVAMGGMQAGAGRAMGLANRGIQAGTNMAGRMAASPQAAAASKALRAVPGQARGLADDAIQAGTGLANRGIQAGKAFASRNRTPLGLGAAGLGGYGLAGGFNSQKPSWSAGGQDLDIPNNWAQQLGGFGNMAGTGQGMPPGVIRNVSRSDF